MGRTTDLNITLQPAGRTETVTITGAAPLVETTKTDVGGVVENREVTNLPLNGRNFSSLATLIPGARPVGSWDPTKTRIGAASIAGAGGRNINTTVDGIDNKDNTVGGYVQNVSIEGHSGVRAKNATVFGGRRALSRRPALDRDQVRIE